MTNAKEQKRQERELAKWEKKLSNDGLGVIDVEARASTSYVERKLGRKHAWLEGEEMGVHYEKGDPRYMSPSPLTVQAVETRMKFGDDGDLSYVAGDRLLTDLEFEQDEAVFEFEGGSLEDLMLEQFDESDYVDGESVIEQLAGSLTASRKEAELADRSRSTVLGLNQIGLPYRPTRNSPLNAKQRNENRRAGELGLPAPHQTNPYITVELVRDCDVVQRAPLRFDYFKKEQGLPCAHTDAGNGPLSIVEKAKPVFSSDRNDGEVLRMAPLVPTMYYYPGRSPFEMGRFAAANSDITG